MIVVGSLICVAGCVVVVMLGLVGVFRRESEEGWRR